MSDKQKIYHLHIENSPSLGDVFKVTQAIVDEALKSYPDIAENIKISIGENDAGFKQSISTADVLFGCDFNRETVSRMGNRLLWIQLQGAGVNQFLPFDWVPQGVTITNSRGAHGKRASEYLIMSLLVLNNGLPRMITNQRNCKWQPIHSQTIGDKTLLIIGVGRIGGDVAELAKMFGMKTIGIRRTATAHPSIDEMYAPEDLHRVLPQADFIVVTAPHTQTTNRIIGEHEIGLMRHGAGFISYSRSGLVDYEALRKALLLDRISVVADVFDEEPLPANSPLWHTPNLIITPHSSSNDPVNHARRSLEILFENVARHKAGLELKNIVDPQQQY